MIATLELLRAFLPGALLVAPEIGLLSTAGAVTSAIAVLILAPLLALGLLGRLARPALLVSFLSVALTRGLLLLDPAAATQLVIAGVGAAAGLAGLVLLATTAAADRRVRLGVLAGLAVEALVRAATSGLGLLWSTAPAAILATVLLVLALAVVGARCYPAPARAITGDAPVSWAWLWLVPALVLTATLTATPGRIAVATGWTASQVAVTTAAAQVAGFLAALFLPRLAPIRAPLLAAALLLVGTMASLPAAGWTGVLGPVAVAIGIGTLAGVDAPRNAPSTPRRRALAPPIAVAAAGAVLLLHDLSTPFGLPVNRHLLLLAVALGGAALAIAVGRPGTLSTVRARLRPRAAGGSVLLAAVIVAVVAVAAEPARTAAPATDPDPDQLTVATFHVGTGYGSDARYDPLRQAQVLHDHDVDVVLLTGVERASWMSGGQDPLPLLAAAVGLEHVLFAPGANQVTGHVLLSRYPVAEFVSDALPGGRRTPVRTQLAAVITLGDGEQIGVIGTQLEPEDSQGDLRLPQARAVAGSVARLRERQLPTILLGDLGGPLEGAVRDSFVPLLPTTMPEGTRTFPSTAPSVLRDHVLLSEGLARTGTAIPSTPASTHLPAIVTVERQQPGP